MLLSTMPVVVKPESPNFFFVHVNVQKKNKTKLHNEYVVGLSDAEATFTISVTKDNRVRKTSRRSSDTPRTIYSVHPSFAISLNIKDLHLIQSLQSFFGASR